MPHGFFTIEEWGPAKRGGKSQWTVVCHVSAEHSLSEAINQLEARGEPGFYRVVQTQRMVWAEVEAGKLRLRKWHASSPESLAQSAEAFERDGGKYPVAKARALRRQVKQSRKSKPQ